MGRTKEIGLDNHVIERIITKLPVASPYQLNKLRNVIDRIEEGTYNG